MLGVLCDVQQSQSEAMLLAPDGPCRDKLQSAAAHYCSYIAQTTLNRERLWFGGKQLLQSLKRFRTHQRVAFLFSSAHSYHLELVLSLPV